MRQSMYLFQNQCCPQTFSDISSIGIFFVSGINKIVNRDIARTQAEKNKKMPNFKRHNMDKKACAMTKVNNMFVNTVTLCPADLVSNGKVSLGMSQPSGPHDQAKEATNEQIMTTTKIAKLLFKLLLWSWTLSPSTTATTIWDANIWMPASKRSILRPALSTA